MRHTREEVIQRTIQEFDLLDQLVANLSETDWQNPLPRPETKDPWTVKDALAHITHWKADVIRSPQEVLTWHHQVHADMLTALSAAPDDWFTGKDRRLGWPNDLASHVTYHRVKDIEQALV